MGSHTLGASLGLSPGQQVTSNGSGQGGNSRALAPQSVGHGHSSWFSIISKIQPLSMQGATSHAAQHPWGSPLIHTGHGSTDPSCRGSSPRVQIKAAAFLANIDSGSFSVNLCLIPIKSFGLSPPAGQGAVKQA